MSAVNESTLSILKRIDWRWLFSSLSYLSPNTLSTCQVSFGLQKASTDHAVMTNFLKIHNAKNFNNFASTKRT